MSRLLLEHSYSICSKNPIYNYLDQAKKLIEYHESNDKAREPFAEQLFQNLPTSFELPLAYTVRSPNCGNPSCIAHTSIFVSPKVAQKDCSDLLLSYSLAWERMDFAVRVAATVGIDDLRCCEQLAEAFRGREGYEELVRVCALKQRTLNRKLDVVMKLHAGDEEAAGATFDAIFAGKTLLKSDKKEARKKETEEDFLVRFDLFSVVEKCVGQSILRNCIFPKLGNYDQTMDWLYILQQLKQRADVSDPPRAVADAMYYRQLLKHYLPKVIEAYHQFGWLSAHNLLEFVVRFSPSLVEYFLEEKLKKCIPFIDERPAMYCDYNDGPHRSVINSVCSTANLLMDHDVPLDKHRTFFMEYWAEYILRRFVGPRPTKDNLDEVVTKNPSIATRALTNVRCTYSNRTCTSCDRLNCFLANKGDTESELGWSCALRGKRRRIHVLRRVQAHPCLRATNGTALNNILTVRKEGFDLKQVLQEWEEVKAWTRSRAMGIHRAFSEEFLRIMENALLEDGMGWTEECEAEMKALLEDIPKPKNATVKRKAEDEESRQGRDKRANVMDVSFLTTDKNDI